LEGKLNKNALLSSLVVRMALADIIHNLWNGVSASAAHLLKKTLSPYLLGMSLAVAPVGCGEEQELAWHRDPLQGKKASSDTFGFDFELARIWGR